MAAATKGKSGFPIANFLVQALKAKGTLGLSIISWGEWFLQFQYQGNEKTSFSKSNNLKDP